MTDDETTTEPLGDLDEAVDGVEPEDAVTVSLRNALTEMRAEADRIAGMQSGAQLVESAERFAEAAGDLDGQLGAAARVAEDDGERG